MWCVALQVGRDYRWCNEDAAGFLWRGWVDGSPTDRCVKDTRARTRACRPLISRSLPLDRLQALLGCDDQMIGQEENCDLVGTRCSLKWCSLKWTHPDLCTPFPPDSSNSPKRSQRPRVTAHSAAVQKGNRTKTTTQPRGMVGSDGRSLTASESSNPCRYKLSYMERWNSKSSEWNKNSWDQTVPERMEGEDSGVIKTSCCLLLHMKVDRRVNSSRFFF